MCIHTAADVYMHIYVHVHETKVVLLQCALLFLECKIAVYQRALYMMRDAVKVYPPLPESTIHHATAKCSMEYLQSHCPTFLPYSGLFLWI